MSDNYWDTAGFVEPTESYMKFEKIGDFIEGTMTALDSHTFDGDGHPTPKLLINATAGRMDGQDLQLPMDEDMEVTCGARNLKSLAMSKRPSPGDYIKISFTGKNGRTKIYEMEVRPGGANPEAEAAAPAAAPAESPI